MRKRRRRLSASKRIRSRLEGAGKPFSANDSIAWAVRPGDIEELQAELTERCQALLETLVIDTNDPNTHRTAERVAKMYVREIFRGRYERVPVIVDFPNGKKLDELYVLGPVSVRSTCAHHLCPVMGNAWCGVIPGRRLMGISKFARLTDWVMSRPQIQEEAVVQLADELERHMEPKGLAVVIRASHSCMTWRGVREHETLMTTSVMRGILREAPAARAEFLQFIRTGIR